MSTIPETTTERTNGIGAPTEEPAEVVWTPLNENAAALRADVDRAREAAKRELAAWHTFVAQDVEGRLQELLSDVAARHRRLLEVFRARHGEADEATGVLEYRHGVAEQIVSPTLDYFARWNPGSALLAQCYRTSAAIVELSNAFADEVRLPEPPTMFEPADDDTPVRRARKALRRRRLAILSALLAGRNVGRKLIGRDRLRPVPASRLAPVQRVVETHLRSLVADIRQEDCEAVLEGLGVRLSRLEAAVLEWVDNVLLEERDAEIVAEHLRSPDWSIVEKPADASSESGTSTQSKTTVQLEQNAGSEAADDDESGSRPITARVEDHAQSLQAALDALCETSETGSRPSDNARTTIDETFSVLADDLSKAGTFLLSANLESGESQREQDLKNKRDAAWTAWFAQFTDRLRFCDSLLRIRDVMQRLEAKLVDRTADATVKAVINTFRSMVRRLDRSRQEVVAAVPASATNEDLSGLRDALALQRNRLLDYFDRIFRDLPGLVSSDQALSEPGVKEWSDFVHVVDGLPDNLVLHEPGAKKPGSPTSSVDFRGFVKDTLVSKLPDRLARPADDLRSAVRRTWTETEQVQHVVQYNIDAAIDELRNALEPPEEEEVADEEEKEAPTPREILDRAVELTDDGLMRASQTLDQLAGALRAPWDAFVAAVDRELQEDWVAIHRRARSADTRDEQWASFRARRKRQLTRMSTQLRERFSTVTAAVGKWFTVGKRRAQSLIRIGQSAVGVIDTADVSRVETVEAISKISRVHEALPLIYRRLFSFEPLEEGSLLEGRARDLVWLKQHFGRWREAMQLGVAIIQAPIGSGRTSFLNAVRRSVVKDYEVVYLNIAERIYNPDEFASLLAGAMGMKTEEVTLADLEVELSARKRTDPPLVCILDNLEHLLLRAPQPVSVIERVILFLSRTDKSIYYIGTIGLYAWQFLVKTAGTSVAFVDSYALSPLDRDTLESIISNRHRRSGMSLVFQEPPDPSALMRQKLKRAKTPEARQAVLREDYFDRLWKASGQNIMLALYYWIQSADFSKDGSTLNVRPLKTLSFDFMSGLDLNQAFSLKAFILHKRLSLDDHCRIFNMGKDASTAILESLLNLHLIEAVPLAERMPVDGLQLKRDAIYRLKPMLIHPVTAYLQSKNIVY